MKTVRNKTRRPLRVRLSRGKTLHLGPLKEGRISVHDVAAGGVQRLVEAGELEILDEGSHTPEGTAAPPAGHANKRGHHPGTSVQKRGDR